MSAIYRRFISYIKVKPSEFKDPTIKAAVINACEYLEARDSRITQALIKGTKIHLSHKDPTDPKPVVAVKLLDNVGKRVCGVHVHRDGTFKVLYKQKPPPGWK